MLRLSSGYDNFAIRFSLTENKGGKNFVLYKTHLSFKATLDRQRSVISAECPDISTVINKE